MWRREGGKEGTERKVETEGRTEIEREVGADTRIGKGAEVGVEDTGDTRGAGAAVGDTVTGGTKGAGVEEKDGEGLGPFRKISRRSGRRERAETRSKCLVEGETPATAGYRNSGI